MSVVEIPSIWLWEDKGNEIVITLNVSEGTRSRDLIHILTPETSKIGLKGNPVPLIEGTFFEKVVVKEDKFSNPSKLEVHVETGKVVQTLRKTNRRQWPSLIIGSRNKGSEDQPIKGLDAKSIDAHSLFQLSHSPFIPDTKTQWEYLKLAAQRNHWLALSSMVETYVSEAKELEEVVGSQLPNYDEAIKYLNRAIEVYNDVNAIFMKGLIYKNNLKNLEEAEKWLTVAAEKKFVEAYYHLAEVIEKSLEGKPRDKVREKVMLNWYNESANNNDIKGLLKLADIYAKGFYIKKNIEKANLCYKKAQSIDPSVQIPKTPIPETITVTDENTTEWNYYQVVGLGLGVCIAVAAAFRYWQVNHAK